MTQQEITERFLSVFECPATGLKAASRFLFRDRLNRLVAEGILERLRYSDRPERYEYRLTAKGRDLNVPLTGLMQWGDKYLSEKPPRVLRRKGDRKRVIAALVPRGVDSLRPDEVELVPGPGVQRAG